MTEKLLTGTLSLNTTNQPTDNIDNPDYDTCVYWTVELNQDLNFAWHNRFIEGGK